MPAVVEFPAIVQQATERFGTLFANQPERRHFAEYLTGLFVAERKNVSGINAQFALTTDQSCLNRWGNEVHWDAQVLHDQRRQRRQSNPTTRYSRRGVIASANVLNDHQGKLLADVGWFWDRAEPRYKIAHDYLIAN